MAPVPSPSRAASIAATYHGFRDGRDEDVHVVLGWAETIVRGGNWRFNDADGVVQETLIKLVRLAATGKVQDPESFQKFVYTVAKNTCVTIYHRDRTRESREERADDQWEPGIDADAESRLEATERLELFSEIVQRLPEACRRLWDRIYLQRRTPKELASELGISEGNLRVRIHRCTDSARTIYRTLMPQSSAEKSR